MTVTQTCLTYDCYQGWDSQLLVLNLCGVEAFSIGLWEGFGEIWRIGVSKY